MCPAPLIDYYHYYRDYTISPQSNSHFVFSISILSTEAQLPITSSIVIWQVSCSFISILDIYLGLPSVVASGVIFQISSIVGWLIQIVMPSASNIHSDLSIVCYRHLCKCYLETYSAHDMSSQSLKYTPVNMDEIPLGCTTLLYLTFHHLFLENGKTSTAPALPFY